MNSKYVFKAPVKIYREYGEHTLISLQYHENPFADKFTTAVLSTRDFQSVREMLEYGLDLLNQLVKEYPTTIFTPYRLEDRK